MHTMEGFPSTPPSHLYAVLPEKYVYESMQRTSHSCPTASSFPATHEEAKLLALVIPVGNTDGRTHGAREHLSVPVCTIFPLSHTNEIEESPTARYEVSQVNLHDA